MSERIRDAFEILISEMEDPPTWSELEARTVRLTPPPRKRLSGPIVALLAAVGVLVVVGIVGLIRVDTDEVSGVLEWSEREPWPLERRSDFSQVWTGSDLIVWGGLREDTPISFANGAGYSLELDRWATLADSPLSPRSLPVAVWTGEEIIYWGGYSGDGDEPETVVPLTDGAAYAPDTDTWRPIASGPLEGARVSSGPLEGVRVFSGVWTGEAVVVAGPEESDIASYDPVSDSWTLLPPRPQQDDGTPYWTSAFWTGDEIVVVTSDLSQAEVFVYTPETMTWRVMPPSPYTTMDLPVQPGSRVHALRGRTVWLLGFAPPVSGLAGVNIDTEEWVVSKPFPSGDNCSSTQAVVPTAMGIIIESCGKTEVLGDDGNWDEIPTLPRTLPKIPGPDPIWTGRFLLLLEAGIEPGAVNFPDGAAAHLWVLDFGED